MPTLPAILLMCGAVALYVCARAGADALGPGPGRRALALWWPMALTAGVFAAYDQALVGIGLVFAATVSSLGLAQGLVLALGGGTGQQAVSPEQRRLWMLPMPVVLLYLVAGFGGRFSGWMAIFLLVQGLAMALVFVDRLRQEPRGLAEAMRAALAEPKRARRWAWGRCAEGTLAVVVGVAGALLAVAGVLELERAPTSQVGATMTAAFTAATLLAPLLALPMIGSAMGEMAHGKVEEATTSHVGVALLNLCLLIPLLVLSWYAWPGRRGLMLDLEAPLELLSFPGGMWRVDVVVLVVLSLAMWPAALGRWVFSRVEGLFLVTLYAGYLLLLTLTGARS